MALFNQTTFGPFKSPTGNTLCSGHLTFGFFAYNYLFRLGMYLIYTVSASAFLFQVITRCSRIELDWNTNTSAHTHIHTYKHTSKQTIPFRTVCTIP